MVAGSARRRRGRLVAADQLSMWLAPSMRCACRVLVRAVGFLASADREYRLTERGYRAHTPVTTVNVPSELAVSLQVVLVAQTTSELPWGRRAAHRHCLRAARYWPVGESDCERLGRSTRRLMPAEEAGDGDESTTWSARMLYRSVLDHQIVCPDRAAASECRAGARVARMKADRGSRALEHAANSERSELPATRCASPPESVAAGGRGEIVESTACKTPAPADFVEDTSSICRRGEQGDLVAASMERPTGKAATC